MSTYAEVPFWGRNKRLPVDPEDPDVRETFTRGQCHSLAFALHELTGWPIVLMGEVWEGGSSWHHAVVRHPDGGYVDVYGRWLENPEGYDDEEVYEAADPDDALNFIEWSCDEPDPVAARPFAEAVLAYIGERTLVTH